MAEFFRFRGGVHPEDGKQLSCGGSIRPAPLLSSYVVPLQQHIGAPAKPLVKKKDTVLRGQMIAEAGGFVSAAVHAPTSGSVKDIGEVLGPGGHHILAITLEADGDDRAIARLEPMPDWQNCGVDVLKQRLADAGIVGMGGAAFPTHVKQSPPPAKTIDVLIANGVECEPFLTADHRLMLELPEKIITGMRILGRILGVRKLIVGIEANTPDAIAVMRDKSDSDIAVVELPVRYPQGAEKQLIYALTRRKVPSGGLPMDVGCVVQNVGTMAAVAEAVLEGKPLYERVTSITGTPVVNPGNWRLRIGTRLGDALAMAGGVNCDPAKILLGGPMMGQAQYNLEVPILKNASGILLLSAAQVHQFTGEPCISCGRCVDVCPMAIMPGTLSVQIENERFDLAEAWHAMDCIECGCCAFACPTNRPLVQHLRRAKTEIMARRRAQSKK